MSSKAPNIATNLKAIPSGYVLGRTEAGPGAPHLIPISALAQKLVASGGVASKQTIIKMFTSLIAGRGPPGHNGEDGADAPIIPGPAGPQGIAGRDGMPGRDGSDGDDAFSWPIGVNTPATAASLTPTPLASQSANYTTLMTDANSIILHPSADTTARTFTIDSNANVALPIGTFLTFVNQNAGGVITIAITTDTMRQAGAGTTGSRTLAANGIATATKLTATEWIITGVGLT